jgi:hypothetical protein
VVTDLRNFLLPPDHNITVIAKMFRTRNSKIGSASKMTS